jgi:hypothetical protein
MAIQAILAAEPIDVPDDPADLRRELDDARSRFPPVIPLDPTVAVRAAGSEHPPTSR